MFVFHDVEVHSHLAVWCGGFIRYMRNRVVFVVSCAIAQLEHRKILVFEVYAQGCLVLSVVAYSQLYWADNVCHDLKATEKASCVGAFGLLFQSLRTGRQRAQGK